MLRVRSLPAFLLALTLLTALVVNSLAPSVSAFAAVVAAGPVESQEDARLQSSLIFVENVGQFADDALFQVWGAEYGLWLAEDALWVTLAESTQYAALGEPDGGMDDPQSLLDATHHPAGTSPTVMPESHPPPPAERSPRRRGKRFSLTNAEPRA